MRVRQRARPALWWSVAGLAFLVSVAAAVAFAVGLPAAGLDRADKLASVGSLLTGLAALLVSGIGLRVSLRQESAVTTQEHEARLGRATEELAAAVDRQWTQEAGLRHLRRPQPLRVRWSTTQRPVAAPASAVLGVGAVSGRPIRLRLHGDVHDVLDLFRRLPARQLVVLGEPGAGKTALAVLLTLGLLDARAAGEPVPVLLSLSSWDPEAEALPQWLARRLVEDYPALGNAAGYGPQAAERLIRAGRIVPVLDGLDELSGIARPAALARLDSERGPLVLTSRGADYQAAVTASGEFLRRAAVVEIEPVDVTDTAAFLTAGQVAGDDRWRPVLERLSADPLGPLARALSTPLMVQLARATYAAHLTSPGELCDEVRFAQRADIEDHLLESYLPAAYASSTYRPDEAGSWLAFLARHLRRQGTYDLAWWQLDRSVPRLVFGLLAGVLGGLTVALVVAPVAGLLTGLAFGLSGYLVAVLVWWLIRRNGVQRRLRFQRPVSHFATGVVFGLGAGLLVARAGGPGSGLALGMAGGLAEGLVAGVVGGYGTWRSTPTAVMRPLSPRSALVVARATALRQTATAMLVSSVGAAVALLLCLGPGDRQGWLAVGLGVAGGVLVGLDTAFGRFVLAQVLLRHRRRLPWHLMRFLDDAHGRGVLRQAGAVYQFRHARLRDRLAAPDPAPPSVTETEDSAPAAGPPPGG